MSNESLELQQKYIESVIKNLKFVCDLEEANLLSADMVIEAVVENLKVIFLKRNGLLLLLNI